ncbi:MAG: DNA polymerase III subunit beta [Clostridia bacterium]|nr:DNA polymerase III subunit beta [Clostridia bacterium]
MRFSCDRTILNEIINVVQKAASAKSTIPALEGIMIEALESGKIEFTAYDLSISISYTLEAEEIEKGRVILSSRLFGEIIRKLPAGEVTIETDPKTYLTTIQAGNAHFTITGMDPENFPELPNVLGEDGVVLTYSDFKTMVRQTIFAVSVTDLKPILTGVLFELNKEEGTVSAVAVDNFRLAIRKVPFVQVNGNFNKVVIPSRALNELLKILPDSDTETIQICNSKNFVAFRFGQVQMVSRLLEGEFLDYKAALPKDYNFRVKVNVRDFSHVIERASLMANATIISPIRCNFDFDRIDITTASNLGSFNDSIDVEPFSNKMVIGFNYKYMLAALNACDDEEIMIELQSNLAPIILKPMEKDDYLFLVLPLRMKE